VTCIKEGDMKPSGNEPRLEKEKQKSGWKRKKGKSRPVGR
jgi:hypothetical protein